MASISQALLGPTSQGLGEDDGFFDFEKIAENTEIIDIYLYIIYCTLLYIYVYVYYDILIYNIFINIYIYNIYVYYLYVPFLEFEEFASFLLTRDSEALEISLKFTSGCFCDLTCEFDVGGSTL